MKVWDSTVCKVMNIERRINNKYQEKEVLKSQNAR